MSDILPVKDDIKAYFWMVFGYLDGLIPLRSFQEKGGANHKPPANSWIDCDDDKAVKAFNFAMAANQRQTAFYVIPGVVAEHGQASSGDILKMQVLLIDIDDGDTESKLASLEQALGKATMVVESGGVTSEGHTKLHVYWQLMEAASGEDLKQLLELRHKIALSVGGDLHFKLAHQPIRVAGSVYYKGGVAKLVKIRSYNCMEYTLEELVESSKKLINVNVLDLKEFKKSLTNFNNTALPLNDILTSKVYEGGNGEASRFNHLSKIIGYWLRRCHDGLITEEQALEEIHSYNLANVVPSWSPEKIKQEVNGLWKLHIKKYGEPKKVEIKIAVNSTINSFDLGTFLSDKSTIPDDIIAPRILTSRGILVFGGAPKVGKSDFLLSLFVHLAAGQEFLGFKPAKPLKVFYFQTEVEYHYLRERIQNIGLSKELLDIAQTNSRITSSSKIALDDKGVNALAKHIETNLNGLPDIIAVDPIRNVFDGGRSGATENENDSMLFFLRERIEKLRDQVNPQAGIVLVHHTKKITRQQLEEDPFQAFSGASSLRGYYTSGALLYKSETNDNHRHLIFELRNGKAINPKILQKEGDVCSEVSVLEERIAHKTQSTLYDRERERRIKVIIKLLETESLRGKFYLMVQFAEKFRNRSKLGGKRAIYDDCSVAATQGLIKFFNDPEKYNVPLVDSGKGFGFMCTENMQMQIGESINSESGENTPKYVKILPTHFKNECDGRKEKMLNKQAWEVE